MKYRKLPVEIDAEQFTEKNFEDVVCFLDPQPRNKVIASINKQGDRFYEYKSTCIANGLKINTLEGEMTANLNDWIIKGVNGEFYPCKPDIFIKTYRKSDELPLNASKLFDDNADCFTLAGRSVMSKPVFERVLKEIQGVDVKPLIDKYTVFERMEKSDTYTKQVLEQILTDLKQLSSNK